MTRTEQNTNDMTRDEQNTNDDESGKASRGTTAALWVVVGMSALLGAALVLGLRSTGDNFPTEDTAGQNAVVGAEPATVLPTATIPAPAVIDAELTAWHDLHAPNIARILAVLGGPTTQDIDILRIRCSQLEETIPLINTQSPPHAETAEAFSAWMRSLENAVTYCLTDSLALADVDAVQLVGATLKATSVSWEAFFTLLTERVDLTGRPARP